MEILKELLFEWREEGIPDDLVERDIAVKTRKGKANTFAGIRRCGKTYVMFQIIKNLHSKNVFYINFEDDRIINPNIKHLSNLLPVIHETFKVKEPLYLFVDEIQVIEHWEKWARRMAENRDIYLFISGSSSKLTSQEIATSLRGRAITNYVFPLDFPEFLNFKGFEYKPSKIEHSPKKSDLKRLLNEYLTFGGFPEIVLEKDEKEKLKLLRDYFSTIIARDLIERYRIDNIPALEAFMKLILNNFSRYLSFSKSENWMRSIGIKTSKSTLIEYFNYIKSCFFTFETRIFSYSIKDRLQYPIKVYIVDNGFATALTPRHDRDFGWFCENLVAIELYRRFVNDPLREIYYWRDLKHREVDFVMSEGLKVKQLIQVCYDVSDIDTKERELKALVKASNELKCNNLLVITWDYKGEEEFKGKRIKFIPLWKYLLGT